MVPSDHSHEMGNQLPGNGVHSVVIISVFGEIPCCFEVHYNAGFVPDGFHFGVFDSGQGIGHYGKAGNAGCEIPADIPVMKGHLRPFITVFIMHIVDDIQGVHINACQPFHHIGKGFHNLVVFQHIAFVLTVFGTDLLPGLFINTAVQRIKQTFCQVGACAEKLHFLTDSHGGYTACDTVIIAVGYTHQIIIFILDGRSLDGHLRAVTFEIKRQPG